MLSKKWFFLCLLGLFATLLFVKVDYLCAQAVTGVIRGTVTDPTGAAIVDAEITVTNVGTGLIRKFRTGSSGDYTIPFLPLGTYEVSAERTGFQRVTRAGIVLQVDQVAVVNLELPVGAVTETVTVTGGAPLVDITTQQLGAVIDERRVEDLPLNGRRFIELITLVPGTTTARPGEPGAGTVAIAFRGSNVFTANGFRPASNTYLFDGVDNNQTNVQITIALEPIVEGIQEFRVVTANQPAEYGNFLGGVVNVQSKSGTNTIHGSVFEFFRNSALDAKNFFDDPEAKIPPFRHNQFGFSLGGPIRKDSTFFFADYQGFRLSQGQTFLATVPTEAMRNGDFSGLGTTIYDPVTTRLVPGVGFVRDPFAGNIIPPDHFNPASVTIMQWFPLPNRPGVFANFLNTPVLTRTDDAFDIRIDHHLTANDNLFARYSWGRAKTHRPDPLLTPTNPFGGGGPVAFAGDFHLTAQGLAINETHIFNPRLINEFRFGYTRFNFEALPHGFGADPTVVSGIPDLAISPSAQMLPVFSIPGITTLGHSFALPIFSTANNFNLVDNLTYIRGKHDLKFGTNIIYRLENFFDDPFPVGISVFDALATSQPLGPGGHPFASFLLGYPLVWQRTFLTNNWGRRTWIFGFFAQDTYRASRRLTLNFGLRYEIFAPPTEVDDRQGSFDTDTGQIVLAGNNGTYGRGLMTTDYNNLAPRIGLSYALTADGKTVLRAGYGMSYLQELPGLNGHPTINPPFFFQQQLVDNILFPGRQLSDGLPPAVVPDPATPAGTVRRLDPNNKTGYGIQYNLTIQREITPDLLFEIGYLGSRGVQMLSIRDLDQAPPGPGAISPRRPFYSVAPAVTSIIFVGHESRSNYNALAVKVEKRYSRGLTFLAAYTFGKIMQEGEAAAAGPFGELPLDSYDLARDRGVAPSDRPHVFVFNWTYELPFGRGRRFLPEIGALDWLVGGWAFNGIANLQSGAPFPMGITPSLLNTGGGNRPDRICDGSLPRSERSIDRWFDTSCFVQPPPYEYGDAGRAILRGPGLVNFDLSIFKTFTLREGLDLQWRTEFFNAFNTPHFGFPNGGIGTPGVGTIRGAGPSRQIQFALKLLF